MEGVVECTSAKNEMGTGNEFSQSSQCMQCVLKVAVLWTDKAGF
jgi:hypothetical protein